MSRCASATRPTAQTSHERDIRNGPHPGLLAAGEVGLDQDRIGQQAEHRARIREGEEAVRHRPAIRSRIPRLQQRARRRQQKIRQPDRRGQQARGSAAAGLRRPAASTRRGQNRQREETQREQRHMDHTSACGPTARSPSARTHNRRAAPSGRTACNSSRPPPSRRTTAGSAWRSSGCT